MSHELYYTSAPQGLKPGSQGFCTVAMTRGLSAALVERLEAMSAYRPAYPPQDSRAPLNPVVRAHCRLTVGGRTVDVLSRITAAGLDYTQRHNKFAHHVVLEPDELPAGGPAWLLQQPAFLSTEWDGEVRVLPAGRRPPQGEAPAGVCKHWERVTGDAGWAAVLAGAFLEDPARPAYLLFDPGFDPMPLLAEAVGLVHAERRWEVTFSTYYTGLPQGVRCAWRCVLQDSPEAAEADRLPGALVLNLGTALGRSPDGDLARQARTGQAAAAGRAAAPRKAVPATHPPARRPNVAVGRAREIPMPDSVDEDSLDGVAPPPPPVRHAAPPPPPPPAPPRPPRAPAAAPRGGILTGLVIGLLIALPLAGVGIAAVLLTRGGEPASPSGSATPPKATGRGDDTSNWLVKQDDEAKKADQRGDEAATIGFADRLEKEYACKNLADVLKRQVEARKAAERKHDEVEKEVKRLKITQRKFDMLQRIEDLQKQVLDFSLVEKPHRRESLTDIGKQLDEAARNLKDIDTSLGDDQIDSIFQIMKAKIDRLAGDVKNYKNEPRPVPIVGEKPTELIEAEDKMKEYFHHKDSKNPKEKKRAEDAKKDAIELLDKVIKDGHEGKIDRKYADQAKMMRMMLMGQGWLGGGR